ncbi:D-lyxose/D-mannose family sugar isomerase [Breznakiella homolactica]|uniref:D-lyxose ketol-isomerase n=2 Tax=Breznakiella homolactica TaxID=2798577 RepID=A0A7T8BC67_9SPIR|nr:D-lyxose/D-mannose family sugar isomerase [Breznakiella homolactica]
MMYEKAHIVLTESEKQKIEVVDCALDDFDRTGICILTYVNTDLCCAKEMVLMPGQTCPEHTHKPLDNGYMGKEETFRCRYGKVYLHVAGEATPDPAVKAPAGDEAYYTAAREIVLNPGEQYTLVPDTLHWFQAGPEGAVISEFSTASHDEYDIFTDPRIKRV